jgi:tetratricopeptide (TPR) repeat protein
MDFMDKKTPESEGKKLAKGMKFFKMKRWDMALQAFQEESTEGFTDEEKGDLAYYLGLCYTKLERYNDALLYLEQVVTSNAGPMRIYQCRMTLAYIYMTTRRMKMASFELDRLIKSGFRAAQIYSMMAYIMSEEKQPKEAVEMYEKALEIDANNSTAMNGLGFLLVNSDIDVKRGLEYCKKAVANKPQSPAYLDSLGWAYYKTGDLAEARTFLRRALDAAPRESEIKSHMKALVKDAS